MTDQRHILYCLSESLFLVFSVKQCMKYKLFFLTKQLFSQIILMYIKIKNCETILKTIKLCTCLNVVVK